MRYFYRGLLIGYLLKEKVNEVCSFLVINAINIVHKLNSSINKEPVKCKCVSEVSFVVKVTNNSLFNEIFHQKFFQPGWKYFNNKNTLKIELPEDTIKEIKESLTSDMTINELFDIKDKDSEYIMSLDLPLFESFGKVYMYFTYYIDSQKFMNVYSLTDTISKSHFNVIKMENPFENVLCASVKCANKKIEYVTNHLKLFSNNRTSLTPELMLLNSDKFNIETETTKLVVIYNKLIKEYSSNDLII